MSACPSHLHKAQFDLIVATMTQIKADKPKGSRAKRPTDTFSLVNLPVTQDNGESIPTCIILADWDEVQKATAGKGAVSSRRCSNQQQVWDHIM